MRTILVAGALLGLSATIPAAPARAAEPELSVDARRMLSYGVLAVMTGICDTVLTPEQDRQIKTGMQAAAQAQSDLNQAQLTDAMTAAGARVRQDKDQICAALTPEFVKSSLADAAAGR